MATFCNNSDQDVVINYKSEWDAELNDFTKDARQVTIPPGAMFTYDENVPCKIGFDRLTDTPQLLERQ